MYAPHKRIAVASAILCMFAVNAHAAGAGDRTAAPPASASDRSAAPAPSTSRPGAVDITTWDQADLRQGFSAERLMDMKAKGSKGENIGDVKDILVDRNGKVTALIISHGGVFGIGDKELRVPFNQVKTDAKLESLVVPIAKENVENFRIKGDRQAKAVDEMKVSKLLKDEVALRGGAKYGDVEDIIISRDGQVKAIVVDADDAQRRGRYAMPWRGDVYDPARNRFTYDYERNQIDRLRPFDYTALGITEPGRRSTAERDTGTSRGGTPGRAGEGAASGTTR